MKKRNIILTLLAFILTTSCEDEKSTRQGKMAIIDVETACWDVGVAVQDGRMFHGPCALRINLALPLSKVKEEFIK